MADSDTPNTPPKSKQGGRAAGRKQAPPKDARTGSKNPSSRSRGKSVDRTGPLHQARVFAMQALFEDDQTHHGLEDIVQHIGEQTRREHGEYFSRIRVGANKANGEIGFLARNTDTDTPNASVKPFQNATAKVLRDLFADPEASETDLTDDNLSRNRSRVEKQLREALTAFINSAEKHLEAEIAAARGQGEFPGEDVLRELESATATYISETLTREELSSRETLMDIMQRGDRLARGVQDKMPELDPPIEKAAPAYPMPLLASIDRVVLRLAVYELLFQPDVPFKVAINEAVEIAKGYGGPNSGRFVNGVLRTISEALPASRKGQVPGKA